MEFEKTMAQPNAWAKPNYIYFNFQSGHFPYAHKGMRKPLEANPIPRGSIKASNRAWVERTYWNALAYDDAMLGELIADIKRMGVWDDTILIITGDHGEALFEDGFLGHGHIINSRQYRTAFVTNKPGYGGANPIALTDYRAMTHAIVAGSPAPKRTEPILVHVGPLDTPSSVGAVDQSETLTVLTLANKSVQLREDGPWVPLASLRGAELARVNALIALWGRERWRRHVSEREIKRP
jgi:Sulfatase